MSAFQTIKWKLLKYIKDEMSIHYQRKAKLDWGNKNISILIKTIPIYKLIYANYKERLRVVTMANKAQFMTLVLK